MSDLNKIIRVLDLSKSDAREGTLDGIIKYIIYNAGISGIEQKDLSKAITKELTLEVHDQDVTDSLNRLEDEQIIEKTDKGHLKLNSEEELKFKKQTLEIEENRKARFKLFKTHIEKIATELDYPIVEDEIDQLWEIFRTFIYDCYLTHGKNAISSLINTGIEQEDSVKRIVNKYKKEANNKELAKILDEYIRIYPSIIDSNILKYLTELANKTEAFYSLGISNEEYQKLYEDLKFDWIVFVDTNFIYSVLSLHNHPENQAAKFLLELGTELGIKFRYTNQTYNELNYRKADFDKYLKKDLQPSQIKALLNSGKLDSFAESFYQKLLEDKDNTPHPSEIITHSQNSMKSQNLVIYNSKFENLTNNEEYLLDQESQYNSYLSLLDDAREEKGMMRKGQKDPKQVRHDVFLREAILSLRNVKVTSMNTAKYFGVTLDKTLIKFDINQLRKKAVGVFIPTFFKPSILLKKLLKQAPLKTKENYLRAFVSTISTPAIEDNSFVSKVAIRSVKYFHNIGIDNEKLILGCLKDELFLKNFEKNENDEKELNEFVESEINKQIKIQTDKIEELERANKKESKRLKKASELSNLTKAENEKLNKQTSDLETILKLYKQELAKLQKKKDESDKPNALQLDIYSEEKNIKSDIESKRKDEIRDNLLASIKKERLLIRRLKGIGYLIVGLAILFSIFLIFVFQDKSWNYMSFFISSVDGMDDTRKNIIYILLPILLGLIDFFIIKKVNSLLFDRKSKTEFLRNVEKEFLEK